MNITRLTRAVLIVLVIGMVGGLVLSYRASKEVESQNKKLERAVNKKNVDLITLQQSYSMLEGELRKNNKENVQLKYDKSKLDEENRKLEKEVDKPKEQQVIKTRSSPSKNKSRPSNSSSYKSFTATAYCPCKKCNGKWVGKPTASGTTLTPGRTIAVDPNVIPLGSKVEIKGQGVFTAEDTGGKIKGNIIDILKSSHSEANKWGRQDVQLRILE